MDRKEAGGVEEDETGMGRRMGSSKDSAGVVREYNLFYAQMSKLTFSR